MLELPLGNCKSKLTASLRDRQPGSWAYLWAGRGYAKSFYLVVENGRGLGRIGVRFGAHLPFPTGPPYIIYYESTLSVAVNNDVFR